MRITKVQVIAKAKLTPEQIEVGAMFLTVSNGRGAMIADITKIRNAKTAEEIKQIFKDGNYLLKSAETFDNYKNDLKKGMMSRISILEKKDWFNSL
jgi:hypothetical protein